MLCNKYERKFGFAWRMLHTRSFEVGHVVLIDIDAGNLVGYVCGQ